MVKTETSKNPENSVKFSEFLNERSREIEMCILKYLRKQFKVTAFSNVYEGEIDVNLIFKENKLLKETVRMLQKALKAIISLINERDDIQIPFSTYETFDTIVNTEIENLGRLEILKMEKTAFNKDQF